MTARPTMLTLLLLLAVGGCGGPVPGDVNAIERECAALRAPPPSYFRCVGRSMQAETPRVAPFVSDLYRSLGARAMVLAEGLDKGTITPAEAQLQWAEARSQARGEGYRRAAILDPPPPVYVPAPTPVYTPPPAPVMCSRVGNSVLCH